MKLINKLKIGLSIVCAGTWSISSYAQTTVLLTGAAGFIGSNFLKYMFDKYPEYQFIILDNLTYAGNLNNFPALYVISITDNTYHYNQLYKMLIFHL